MKPANTTKPETGPLQNHNTQSMTSSIIAPKEIQVSRVLFTLRWRLMTQILLALPVLSLFVCLITSLIFHADHINNTICKVYNFLPSISAVTGVSPQRYLWRVCVALHISPRLLVAWVAKEFYNSMATRVPAIHRSFYNGMVTLAFCLNLTELATLCGVTYISNKENYPVHEKLFMVFMIASLVYMICVVRLLDTVRHALSPVLLRSLSHKRWLLGTKIGATLGLLFFFWRHRVHCQPKAFSWFSLCEYIIATCNMLYHVSVALDFSDEHLIVGHIVTSSPSVTTPDTSMVSSFTVNSFNEFSNAVDKTPEADFIIDEVNFNTSNKKELLKENLNEELVPGVAVLPPNFSGESKNNPLDLRISPLNPIPNTVQKNLEETNRQNITYLEENKRTQEIPNRVTENSEQQEHRNINSETRRYETENAITERTENAITERTHTKTVCPNNPTTDKCETQNFSGAQPSTPSHNRQVLPLSSVKSHVHSE